MSVYTIHGTFPLPNSTKCRFAVTGFSADQPKWTSGTPPSDASLQRRRRERVRDRTAPRDVDHHPAVLAGDPHQRLVVEVARVGQFRLHEHDRHRARNAVPRADLDLLLLQVASAPAGCGTRIG